MENENNNPEQQQTNQSEINQSLPPINPVQTAPSYEQPPLNQPANIGQPPTSQPSSFGEQPQPISQPAPQVPITNNDANQPVGIQLASQPNPGYGQTEVPKTNIFAILGLVFAFLFTPLGLLFSIIGLNQINKKGQSGKGLAIAGLVISAIGLLIIPMFALMVISTLQGVQQKGRDTERQADIRQLSSMLEAYNAMDQKGYPTLADLNKPAWRAINMKGLDASVLCDPHSSTLYNCELIAQPVATKYSYQTWQSDGTKPCSVSSGNTCPKYTLTAVLEGTTDGNGVYAKDSLN